MICRPFLAFVCVAACSLAARGAEYVSVRGSAVVARVMEAAAPELAQHHNIEFRAVTDASSSEAISQVANGVIDLAIAARMIKPEEKASRPDKRFVETVIGKQAVAVIVSDDLWRNGVQTLTKTQLRDIYERRILNWKEVGGPNRAITFFNRESTYGVWDLYMTFLYEDVRRAGLSKSEVIDNPEEAKTAVEFSTSSFSLLELGAYTEGKGIHALGIKQPDGTVVEPTLANIANDRYEIARPLVLITSKQPTGKLREMVEFMISPKGQAAVRKCGNIPATDLVAAKKKN
jgi:phosphate transport system substrate-binding protein